MADAQGLWKEHDTAVAVGTPGVAINGWEFHRLRGKGASVGLLAIETAVAAITPEDERIIDSMLPEIARIVERISGIVQQPTSNEHSLGKSPAMHR
jgi:K+-sensing histidine kinase KdpD